MKKREAKYIHDKLLKKLRAKLAKKFAEIDRLNREIWPEHYR